MRVIIVGGGIGGMTTAIALGQRGIDVEVYEQATQLAEVGAGVSLWPNALKALHQLGLREVLESMSAVSETGAVRDARGTILSQTSAREFVSRFGLPVTVFHRAELLEALVRAAGSIPIHLGHTCQDIRQDANTATVCFTNGAQATGDAVVGADGLRSTIRDRLRVPGELRYAGYTAWRGIAPFDTQHFTGGETLGRGRRFGLAPIVGNRVYWYATNNEPEAQRESPSAAKTRLLQMFETWHPPIPAVIAATDAAAILRHDIYDRDPVDRWGDGRVTLVGDAAHPMTPNLGQGACQAIEDALLLARQLAAGPDVESSLRQYESARMQRTRPVVMASRRVGQLGQVESPIVCRLRDLALRLTPRSMTYRNLAPVVGYEGHLGR